MLENVESFRSLLELFVCAITFIGILSAFDNRITDSYNELIKTINKRADTLNAYIEHNEMYDNEELLSHIRYLRITSLYLIENSRDYKYVHMMYTVIGAIVLLGYAFIVLSGLTFIMITEYTLSVFFVSWIVLIVGMAPSICHLLKHRKTLHVHTKLQYVWDDFFGDVENNLKNTKPPSG